MCLFNSEESKIDMTFRRNQKRKYGLSYHVDTKAYFKAVLIKRYGSAVYKIDLNKRPVANSKKPRQVSHTYAAASSRTESEFKMPGRGWAHK